MAYVQRLKRKAGDRYRMFWRVKDPQTGESKLVSRDYKGSGGKAEAQKEARLLEAQDHRRPITTEGDGTISDFLSVWVPTATQGLSPASAYNVRWAVGHISVWIGGQKLSKFSALTMVNLTRQASATGIAPITQRKIMRTFKKAIRAAVNWQLLGPEALATLDAADPIRVRKPIPVLRTIEESQTLATAIRPVHPFVADMVLVAAYTGMRYGEIAALAPEQVDLGRGRLTVDRTAAKNEKLQFRVKRSPKTEAGFRVIPIAPELLGVLSTVSRPLMFPDARGNPISPSTASIRVKSAAKPLGIQHGFHCSRHYYASLLIDRGIPLPKVSRIMGHSSVRVTMEEYAWCIRSPSDDESMLDALSSSVAEKRGDTKQLLG